MENEGNIIVYLPNGARLVITKDADPSLVKMVNETLVKINQQYVSK